MTSKATFGDLATAASRRLEHAANPVGADGQQAGPVDVAEFARGLTKFVEVMTRYLDDVVTPTAAIYREWRRVAPWAWAGAEARDALRNAARTLQPVSTTCRAGDRDAGPLRSELDAATQLLSAGRDLLHTHLSTGPDGTQLGRSEWAPVIGSAPITQALMLELGQWVRLAATQGGQLAVSRLPARQRADDVRPELNAACQWLWAAHSTILAAQRNDPAPVADTWLLHAIPVNVLPARHRPDGRETVADLCDGATDSAERVRHLVRAAIPEAAWSPEFSADSLREAAACATAISHHNSVLLRTIADSASRHSSPAVGAALIEASTAAADARTAWLSAPERGRTSPPRPAAQSSRAQPRQRTWRCGPADSPTPTPAGPSPKARNSQSGHPSPSPPTPPTSQP